MPESKQPHQHSQPLNSSLSGVKNVIAIASGKGGVGKSTLSVNLAVALAKTGAKVGLMDADIYGPSQPGMLGAREARPDVSGDMLQPVKKYGISFVSMGLLIDNDGPVIWRAPMAMKIIHQFIGNVNWGKLDYLLIDLPPGTGDVQLTLAQQASLTGAVIVTTPQQVALGVAAKGLRMFEQVNVPILGVIENMSGFVCKHCSKTTDIFKVGGGEALSKHTEVPYLGAIPLDPEIMMSGDTGVPVLETGVESPAAKALLNVAKNLQTIVARVSAAISEDEPEQIELRQNGDLVVTWHDGRVSNYNAYSLRINCPCASCIDEDSGRRTLDPKRVPLDIRIESFEMIGRYAVALHFSDGHRTGLYAFKLLQKLPEADSSASFEV